MGLIDHARLSAAFADVTPFPMSGRVTKATGVVVHATLPRVSLGTLCDVLVGESATIEAEVIGFDESTALLMPIGPLRGIHEGSRVIPRQSVATVAVSNGLMGRVVDARLSPIDGGPSLSKDATVHVPLHREPPPAMRRRRIEVPLETGIRALDAVLTVGEGQRIGIVAGPGVGKSVLLGMLARTTNADAVVVALVGERGREVREFVERDLGPEGLKKTIVVTATADEPPLVRVRATLAATCVAEALRDQGKRVLLLVDSLTRFGMAHREIGLAAGEPPTSKGYPPSVFGALPRLLERAGQGVDGSGSITAIYTVLAEGDDLSDPIVDASRAALDGHIVLSRSLAASGHFPAIDIAQSVSRVMTDVATAEEVSVAREVRELMAAFAEAKELIEVGAYVRGSNPKVDRAVDRVPRIIEVLRQPPDERTSREQGIQSLREAIR